MVDNLDRFNLCSQPSLNHLELQEITHRLMLICPPLLSSPPLLMLRKPCVTHPQVGRKMRDVDGFPCDIFYVGKHVILII